MNPFGRRRRPAPAFSVTHHPAAYTQWGYDMRPVGCGVLVVPRDHALEMKNSSTDMKGKPVDAVVTRQVDATGVPVTDWVPANA